MFQIDRLRRSHILRLIRLLHFAREIKCRRYFSVTVKLTNVKGKSEIKETDRRAAKDSTRKEQGQTSLCGLWIELLPLDLFEKETRAQAFRCRAANETRRH